VISPSWRFGVCFQVTLMHHDQQGFSIFLQELPNFKKQDKGFQAAEKKCCFSSAWKTSCC